jgi:hypothetical protein
MARKTKPGYKRCPSCTAVVKGPRTKVCPKCSHEFEPKKAAAAVPETAAATPSAETKPSNGITIAQIKAVGQMVKTIGGFRRLHEMLGVIKEVGGTKKFKDLLDAIAVEPDAQP